MDAAQIRDQLFAVIAEVQEISGLECPVLNGNIRPARDVKDFTSEVWPVAIAMLEERIDIQIPEDENLFYDDKAKTALSIDQCVQKVLSLHQKGPASSGEDEKKSDG